MATRNLNAGKRAYRVLIVDDHPITRQGLGQIIRDESEFELCGEAEGSTEALRMINDAQPDLMIIDLSLKDGSGIELIKQIKSSHEKIAILVSSMHDESLFAERALRAGALGYLNKQEAVDDIVEAMRQVLKGKIYLSTRMAERLLNGLTNRGHENASPMESLSDRELEVFELIGQGMSTSEIAKRLHLSVKTIETHRENIKKKLGLENHLDLTRHAMQWVLELGKGA